ncbi:MAG: ATP-binding protein, partial [Bacteroidota bacterium]|nr:ATP-binding protein [Bacteroidota bacterium]
DYQEALHYSLEAMKIKSQLGSFGLSMTSAMVGSVYYEMNNLDSALAYLNKAVSLPPDVDIGWIYLIAGRVHAKMKNTKTAFQYYKQSIDSLSGINNLKDLAGAYVSIGQLYNETGHADSAIYFGNKALNIAQQKKFNKELLQSYFLLANVYEKTDSKKALDYYHQATNAKDSLFNQEKQRQILSFKFNEELQQQQLEKAQTEYNNRIKIYILLAALTALTIIGIILYRNNRHKKIANALLQQQKEKVESTLTELKSTQAQLIQSEKMASLGELTAGIAHEIQNPLNFVNNFSEVNKEMLVELNEEIDKGNYDDAKSIAKDVIANEEKINHHGKRADAIVKGMLQHSRQTSGTKEPTDINALCDEYLRLAYHGLRAKEKSFNAVPIAIGTDFDRGLSSVEGKINIVPQDIGRVLLNLFNNALYSVNEKKKTDGENYKPAVFITTKKITGKLSISVKDNGNGIPQNIVDKIFQPFFTTKPTGQGTGLGLSLAYDIITKEHNGTIKAESKEGEGSIFIIQLPIS